MFCMAPGVAVAVWRVPYGAVSAGTFRSLGSNAGRFSGRLIDGSFVSVASVSVWEI